jgi:WD40 repeat protein
MEPGTSAGGTDGEANLFADAGDGRPRRKRRHDRDASSRTRARAAGKRGGRETGPGRRARRSLPEGAVARLGTVRFRGVVFQVVFGPDGKTVVAHGMLAGVRVWDAATGRELRRFPEKSDLNRPAKALSPDGRLVVVMEPGEPGQGWTLGRRDVMTGKQVRAIGEGKSYGNAEHVQFSPDGKLLAVVENSTNEPVVEIWDVGSGEQRCAMSGHKRQVWSAQFTGQGNTLMTGAADGRIILWDTATGKQVRELVTEPGVGSAAVSTDGRRVASVHWSEVQIPPNISTYRCDNRVRIWDLETSKELRQIVVDSKEDDFGVPQGFRALFFTPDNELFAIGPDDARCLWDPETGKKIRQLPSDFSFPLVSPDGKTAATSSGASIQLIDRDTGKELHPFSGHRTWVVDAVLSADKRTAVTLGHEPHIFVWNVEDGRERLRLAGHEERPLGVTLSRDGRTLFSVGTDNTLRVWDLTTGRELRKWAAEATRSSWATVLALSPDEKNLAVAKANGKLVRLFDPAKGQERGQFKHAKQIKYLAFTPEATLTVCCVDHSVHVWDLATGRRLEQFDLPLHLAGREAPIALEEKRGWDFTALISPDGKHIGYGCHDVFALVDLATGRPVQGGVRQVPGWPRAFSPDGCMLACSSGGPFDGAITLIDVATGQERRKLAGHQGQVNPSHSLRTASCSSRHHRIPQRSSGT